MQKYVQPQFRPKNATHIKKNNKLLIRKILRVQLLSFPSMLT